jgi:SAM-dependent methyltransferase
MRPGLHAVPIVGEGERFEGIVTAMDIVRKVAKREDPAQTTVGRMGSTQAFAGPEDTLDDVVRTMSEHGASIVPVVEDGRLLGVMSRAEINGFRPVVRLLGERAGELNTEIADGDSMADGVRGAYFLAAASALEVIRQSLAAAGDPPVESILDFPCGWGRVLRMLRVAFPKAALTVSDIDRGGVDFCARTFGARPAYSAHDPADVDLGEAFDLIWCGSLFTHLPAERWRGFLDLFARSLRPGGVLVFTTLAGELTDVQLRALIDPAEFDAIRERYERDGHGYVAQLGEDLGLMVTSREWTTARVQEHPALRLVRYDERSWNPPAPAHDVTTCVRE